MGTITYNSISSNTLGLKVETFPEYKVPRRLYNVYQVPGRNGDIVVDTGAYENATRTYNVNIAATQTGETYVSKVNSVVEWLNSTSGYARLEDTYDPDHFWYAYYANNIDFENIFNEAGRATLDFICKPQRYLKSGETAVNFTGAGDLQNGTNFIALPLITITVASPYSISHLNIGNYQITIKAEQGSNFVIDCELQDVYDGVNNKNNSIEFSNREFPKLMPGTTHIGFDNDITNVSIVPRWWTI